MTALTQAADGAEGGGGASGTDGADPGGRKRGWRRGWTPEQLAYIERLAREKYGSLNRLAAAMDVTHGTVYKWRNPQRGVTQEVQRRLAEALGLPWPTDFLPPPAPADTPTAGPNVYGTTREVYGKLGYRVRPVYRAGTRQDLTTVGAESYPLPVAERPVPPDRGRQVGEDAFVLLHSGNAMAGRRPEAVLDGDFWWFVPAARRPPRPGDLVAARVEDTPPGAEDGVLLRTYDAAPGDGEPALYAEPVGSPRTPVAGRWTVVGVALFGERSVAARYDA